MSIQAFLCRGLGRVGLFICQLERLTYQLSNDRFRLGDGLRFSQQRRQENMMLPEFRVGGQALPETRIQLGQQRRRVRQLAPQGIQIRDK